MKEASSWQAVHTGVDVDQICDMRMFSLKERFSFGCYMSTVGAYESKNKHGHAHLRKSNYFQKKSNRRSKQ